MTEDTAGYFAWSMRCIAHFSLWHMQVHLWHKCTGGWMITTRFWELAVWGGRKNWKLTNLELKKKKISRKNPEKSKEENSGTEDDVLSCLVILRGRLGSFPVMVMFMCLMFMGLHGTSAHFIFHLLKLLTTASDFNTYFQGHSVQNAVVMNGNTNK